MLRAQILELEDIAQKTPRVVRDHDLIWFGAALQACRKVGRLSDDAALPQPTRIRHLADDHQSGGNSDPGLQRSVCLQIGDRGHELQRRPHRPLGVVFVSLRIAEKDQYAVAQILRYEAAQVTNRFGDAFPIGRNDFAQILRIHAGGERGRPDQIREHHRHLPAFGGVRKGGIERRVSIKWYGDGIAG